MDAICYLWALVCNFLSIAAVVLLVAFISLAYIVLKLVEKGRQYFFRNSSTSTSTGELDGHGNASTSTISIQKKITKRLCSLDAFRGLAIVTMIFANTGAGKYHWLEHASWNGIHPADFIFPSFLWIMGVCIPISLKSQFAKNIPRHEMLSTIFIVRSVHFFN